MKRFVGPKLSLQEWRVLFSLANAGESEMSSHSHDTDNLLRKVGAAIGFDEVSGRYVNHPAWGTDVPNSPK